MKKKQWISIILSAAMIATAVPSYNAFAERADADNILDDGSVSVYDEAISITDTFEDLPDNDELFGQYVDRLFFGDYPISTFGNYGEERLQGVNLKAYQILKDNIQKIAAGERENTEISMSLTDLGIKTTWTAQELGVDSITSTNIKEVVEALNAKGIYPDTRTIVNYLLVDCPFDLYWCDKTKGWRTSSPSYSYSSQQLTITGDLTCSFSIAEGYKQEGDDEFLIKTDAAQTAKIAADNAKQIVSKYSSYSDHDKLVNYRKEICELVSYNHDAADDQNTAYGDPWQFIWVFDGDPSTNVVCEGYSKAFQYLCDLTAFSDPNIRCYTVSGTMSGGTGAGGHMWNVVTMQDKKNYIVDVTNCDEGSIGANDKLFLSGAEGNVSSGYKADIPGQSSLTYTYDDDIVKMYGDILILSSSKYDPASIPTATPTNTPEPTPTDIPVPTPVVTIVYNKDESTTETTVSTEKKKMETLSRQQKPYKKTRMVKRSVHPQRV